MKEEVTSLEENKTWKLVKIPEGSKDMNTKWMFDIKTDENNTAIRHKRRQFARGFTQEKGVDYYNAFSLVVRYSTLRYFYYMSAIIGNVSSRMSSLNFWTLKLKKIYTWLSRKVSRKKDFGTIYAYFWKHCMGSNSPREHEEIRFIHFCLLLDSSLQEQIPLSMPCWTEYC